MNGYRYGAYDDGPDPAGPAVRRGPRGRRARRAGARRVGRARRRCATSAARRRRRARPRRPAAPGAAAPALARALGPDGRHARAGPRAARPGRRRRAAGAVPRPVRRRALPRGAARRAADARPRRRCASCAEYDWRSPEARAAYDELRDMLRREVLDQQFRGMKQALQDPADSESRQALKDMMADLNAAAGEARSAARTPTQDFADFMDKHGEFFPENPRVARASCSTSSRARPPRCSGCSSR